PAGRNSSIDPRASRPGKDRGGEYNDFVKAGSRSEVEGAVARSYSTPAASRRRAFQFVPGESVAPCSRIEAKTASAAMLKILWPASTSRPRIRSEKAIVATPFGPNHAMNALLAFASRVPASANQTAAGRAIR